MRSYIKGMLDEIVSLDPSKEAATDEELDDTVDNVFGVKDWNLDGVIDWKEFMYSYPGEDQEAATAHEGEQPNKDRTKKGKGKKKKTKSNAQKKSELWEDHFDYRLHYQIIASNKSTCKFPKDLLCFALVIFIHVNHFWKWLA